MYVGFWLFLFIMNLSLANKGLLIIAFIIYFKNEVFNICKIKYESISYKTLQTLLCFFLIN